MKITTTDFQGLIVLEPLAYEDERGYFMESYNSSVFLAQGIDIVFVQDNQSLSKRGVIRGMHFQNNPKAQTKLVRVLKGVILDVVVDLRRDQPTFGMTHSVELSAENRKQLLVPKGFAHGFSVLSEAAEVLYKTDEYYAPSCESGLSVADPALAIDWKIAPKEWIVSTKDQALPNMAQAKFNF